MTEFDFQSFDPKESQEEIQEAKRAEHNEIRARHMLAMKKELQQAGGKVLHEAQIVQVSLNPVSQEQYNARRYSLKAILREPQRALARYPMKATWEELYKGVPYWDKATSAKLQRFEREELVAFAKEQGIYSRQSLQTVQDFVKLAELAHRTSQVETLNEQLQEFSYLMDKEANAIIYKGHVIKYSSSARAYLLKLGNKTLKISEGNIKKQLEVFEAIDALEALCSTDQ